MSELYNKEDCSHILRRYIEQRASIEDYKQLVLILPIVLGESDPDKFTKSLARDSGCTGGAKETEQYVDIVFWFNRNRSASDMLQLRLPKSSNKQEL